jgi:hypothetical protein
VPRSSEVFAGQFALRSRGRGRGGAESGEEDEGGGGGGGSASAGAGGAGPSSSTPTTSSSSPASQAAVVGFAQGREVLVEECDAFSFRVLLRFLYDDSFDAVQVR